MAIIRTVPKSGRAPSLRGSYMIDTVRGVLRVRKWPKKRGPPRSAAQRFWVDWFTQANRLAHYVDGMAQVRAIEMTKLSGMYPRDVLLKAMRGRLYSLVDQNGWKWFSMAAIQDISDTLDILGQTVGDVLVRATDRWRPPPTGNVGEVLTHAGPGAPPGWATPAPATVVQATVVYANPTQSIVTNTTTAVVFDQTLYDDANLHDPALNPSRFTAPAGAVRMRLNCGVGWTGFNGGLRDVYVFKNGAALTPWIIDRHRPSSVSNAHTHVLSYDVPVIVGDYLEVMVWQNSGANRTLMGTPFVWAHCLLNP